jgi:hypothetical protein
LLVLPENDQSHKMRERREPTGHRFLVQRVSIVANEQSSHDRGSISLPEGASVHARWSEIFQFAVCRLLIADHKK